jgi:hypothetical protein
MTYVFYFTNVKMSFQKHHSVYVTRHLSLPRLFKLDLFSFDDNLADLTRIYLSVLIQIIRFLKTE